VKKTRRYLIRDNKLVSVCTNCEESEVNPGQIEFSAN